MSDNQDKRLEDLGWEKMRVLLDREIPVGKQPRRGLVWWWMAAGLALLVTAVFLFPFDQNTEGPVASKDLPDAAHLEKATNINNSDFQPRHPDNSPESSPATQQNHNTTTLTPKSQQVISSPKAIQEKNPAKFVSNEPFNRAFQQENSSRTAREPSKSISAVSPSLIGQNNTPVKVPAFLELKGLQPVKGPASDVINGADRPLQTASFQINKKLTRAIQGGLISENFSRINGGDISLLLSYPIGDRWQVSSGLGIAYLEKLHVLVNSTDTTQYGTQEQYDPNFEAARAITSGSQYFMDEDSYFLLEVPILASYQLSSNWSLFGGIKNSFLLQNRQEESFSQVEFVSQDQSTFNTRIFYTQYNYPVYSLSAVAGGRFQLPSGPYLWGQYQHIFSLDANPVGFRSNRFTMGIGFSF